MYYYFLSALVVSCGISLALSPLKDIPEDATMNFIELSKKYLQKGEEYDLTADDGYILKIFRIPGDRNKPILLVHGAVDPCDTFIMRGNSSLAVALARDNYDIWAMNLRGNRYSRRHIIMNPDLDKNFWDFSVHEFGYYDLPAAIDFVLNITKQQRLSVIGYSEGTMAGYVMGATRPEYNSKISVYISMAPICYMHNVREYMSLAMDLAPFLNRIFLKIGIEGIIGDNSTAQALVNALCLTDIGYQNCLLNGILLLTGPNAKEIEPKFLPLIVKNFLTGTSRKNLNHLLQIRSRRTFANYDYGLAGNIVKYNSATPPKYDLNKVTMRVALLASKNDRISTIKDVELLKKELPNVVDYRVMESDEFNHVDYVWGRTAHKTVYPSILQILNKYQ